MKNNLVNQDPWGHLRSHTQARIAQGRAGRSVPTHELLMFQADHALARDAVYSELNISDLQEKLTALFQLAKTSVERIPRLVASLTETPTEAVFVLKSQAQTRQQYLQRPDLGRKLHPNASSAVRRSLPTSHASPLAFVIADGLSASAVNTHALLVLENLIPALLDLGWTIAPFCLVEQGRVAIADEIGHLLHAEMVVMLIGERPGLSSPDSMGAYLTYAPRPGLTDESRNCVSNIRPEGLDYQAAAAKILYLLTEMKRRQLSGVNLKDEMDSLLNH